MLRQRMSAMRSGKHLCLTLLVCFFLSLTNIVIAHEASILESQPEAGAQLDQAPASVWLRFGEELISSSSWIKVHDASGSQVDQGDGGVDLHDPNHSSMVVSLPSLPDGMYTVRWKATLLDGDFAEESFTFIVGQVSTSHNTNSHLIDISGTLLFIGMLGTLFFLALALFFWQRPNTGSR